jgi:hypothetical protein
VFDQSSEQNVIPYYLRHFASQGREAQIPVTALLEQILDGMFQNSSLIVGPDPRKTIVPQKEFPNRFMDELDGS